MYTILENARIVLALLKEHNIRYIVLSPGGSNIPIVQGVQQDPYFKCYSVVDERSAMYFAIGLHLQTGEIVATSCTSAQATRNYLPGLTEAFYKHVPILAITMSKHPRFLGQDYMQCPIQTSLPVDAVKKSYSLPYISTENDREQCVRIANEAILELTHHGNGPVQLNIEELDSETWVFDESISELPHIRTIKKYKYWEMCNPSDLKGKKIMIVIGEHMPFNKEEVDAIEGFCESYNAFVYTNHTSNFDGRCSVRAFPLMGAMSLSLFERDYIPDIVITIGGLTGDYYIYNMLFKSPVDSFEHWRVDEDGRVVDTYGKLTRIFEMRILDFFSRLKSNESSSHDYRNLWCQALGKISYDIDIPLSNLYIAIELSKLIPNGSNMNFAILNSLRVWSLVKIDKTIQAFSNLAAFGIDGCMSTSFGESVESDSLNFLITGDLAFFYDMNALGIRHLKNNIRIVLCNNNGGMEFKFGKLVYQTDVSSYIAADNHFKNTEGWAKTNNFEYISIHTKSELKEYLPSFVSHSDRPVIMEVFTTSQNEKEAHTAFFNKNFMGTNLEEKKHAVKETIKQFVGGENINTIRNKLHK